MPLRFRCALPLLALALGFTGLVWSQRPAVLRPTVFAIKDARIVPVDRPMIPKGTVVVRDGLIEAVGADVKAPVDALVMDGKDLTVYPGFIDALSNWGFDATLRRSEIGAPAIEDLASEALAATKPDNRKGMTPEFLVSTALKSDEDVAENWRRQGFTAHLVAPEGGIFTGQSALVSLSGAPPREAILRAPVAMHSAFRATGGDYPRALMGIIAHARQTLLDADHYRESWSYYEKNGRTGRRPPVDTSFVELGRILHDGMPVVFEADSKDSIHRALDFASEFRLKPVLFGGKDAAKAVERIKQEKTPVLFRLQFTEQPQGRNRRSSFFATPGAPETPPESQESTLPKRFVDDHKKQLKAELATPALLRKEGIPFAICTQGLERPEKFKENLRRIIEEGLSPDDALKALTLDAARILGVEKQLGSITPGKAAHLVVFKGDFNAADSQVKFTFSDGVRFENDGKPRTPDALAKGDGKADPTGEGKGEGKGRGRGRPPEKDVAAEKEKTPPRSAEPKAEAKRDEEKKPDSATPTVQLPEQATELEADRKPATRTGGNVLIKGANLVTVTQGTMTKTDLLVLKGKIAKIGQDLSAPPGVLILDASDLYVMPGIIDTHCHFAVSGGVNEGTLSVVPEVRVRDVIESEDVQIYKALAGGVTTARLLHGSANVIGGQDAVIKLKYGHPSRDLLIADAPRGVKFALGENVKRTDGRFPNTRLGVEAVLVRAFTEAQAYERTWADYRAAQASGKSLPPPRRDLRLEPLVDILKGTLKVHSHCYRSDEILMLLRVADRFGFRVQSLQHVLEGYKIAPEIAKHGASCSTFSDWWAYKIEAYDAIPHNSALLHEAGALVCLKSDSNELMRHMYQEAAKCMKYGGMSEVEALKTITLNGAIQLGLDKRIGSLDVGKDADLAIFNGHPLNSYARVDMTLVEGEIYFQRSGKLQSPTTPLVAPVAASPKSRPIPTELNGAFAIRGATIHPVSGPEIPAGVVVVEKNRITAVGRDIRIPSNIPVIEAEGLHLFPGMIDAATVLGLTELGSAKETNDYAEGGDFQPDLHASVGINPDSELIPVTRANGVTTVVTRPIGGIIAGQSALINLAGWVPREMAIVDPLMLHVEFPTASPFFTSDPTVPFTGRAVARRQREEKLQRLKELFQQAVAYDLGRKQSSRMPVNPRLEALVPYAKGEKSIVMAANRKAEILEVLKFADELKLKIILNGAIDSWKVASELKKKDIPVIVGPIMALPPETYDPYDAPYACPAKLHEAGVRFCIRSGGLTNTRNLPYEVAMAVSYGLPADVGLKSVTQYPAQILGVSEQLGSIDVGKRANLVLADGDIMQAATQVRSIIINGKPFEPTSKQTKLYERYRERLREVREGKSPLGTIGK